MIATHFSKPGNKIQTFQYLNSVSDLFPPFSSVMTLKPLTKTKLLWPL